MTGSGGTANTITFEVQGYVVTDYRDAADSALQVAKEKVTAWLASISLKALGRDSMDNGG